MNDEQAEKIYQVLGKQRFFDWFGDGGDFDRHIMSDDNCKSKEEIIAQIKQLFG